MLSILKKRQLQLKAAPKPQNEQSVPVSNHTIAAVSSGFVNKPWDEIQATLKQDLCYLRTLAGSQEKDPYKTQLVEKYRPVVEQLLTTHDNLENLEVIWWFYQWQVDLGKLPMVHDALRRAIDQGLETPNSWKMNGQTGYCDMVFKYSFKANEQQLEFDREYLIQAVSDLQEGKLATNAPLKVKMFRLVGDWHYLDGDKKSAYALYDSVMKLDTNKGGRKTRLNELKEDFGYGDSH